MPKKPCRWYGDFSEVSMGWAVLTLLVNAVLYFLLGVLLAPCVDSIGFGP